MVQSPTQLSQRYVSLAKVSHVDDRAQVLLRAISIDPYNSKAWDDLSQLQFNQRSVSAPLSKYIAKQLEDIEKNDFVMFSSPVVIKMNFATLNTQPTLKR